MAGLDWTLKVGGQAGQGMQAIGAVIGHAFVRSGLHIFVIQDFESRIRGGHNFLQMRVSDRPVNAVRGAVDVLVALDAETVNAHLGELRSNGIVVWDPEMVKNVDAGERGFPVPLTKLTTESGGTKVMVNTAAVGAVLGMTRFPVDKLTEFIELEFAHKGSEVVATNLKVARAGHEYAIKNCKICHDEIAPLAVERRMVVTGHQALSLGAIAANVRYMSAYPMSPSTSIIELLARQAERFGIVVEQAEDEIAAINSAVGASFAGARAMTATSGGGLCLMVEGIGLAGMTETPVVIVDAQRPGPSTGLPTRTEQADLLFLIHASHGEFPRAVIAPGNAEQAFACMARAFNLAEKYQTPVFVMTDQYLADSMWTIPGLAPSQISIDRGELLGGDAPADYRRYADTESGVSPRAVPGAGPALVVADSDEHTDEGHITESAAVRTVMMDKRMRKLEHMRREMNPPELYGPKTADVTLLSWGSTWGVAREAVDILNGEKFGTANMYHFTDMWPFPADALGKLPKKARLVSVENNATGQFARLLRMETGITVPYSVLRYDGRPLLADDVASTIREGILS